MAAVHAGHFGPIIVSFAPKGTLIFGMDGLMITSVVVHPNEPATIKPMAMPSDSLLCEQQCHDTWKDLFTQLLTGACCDSGIAIHYITKEEHDTAVAFLMDCGLLDTRIEYPSDLYTDS